MNIRNLSRLLKPDRSLDQYKDNQRLSSLFIAVIKPSVLASFRLSSPAGGVQGASQCPHCSFVQSKKTAQNIGLSHYNSNDRSGLKERGGLTPPPPCGGAPSAADKPTPNSSLRRGWGWALLNVGNRILLNRCSQWYLRIH